MVTGDHSWGKRGINSCQPDMDLFASPLPGRKILLPRAIMICSRTTKKTKQLNEFFNPRLPYFLQRIEFTAPGRQTVGVCLCGTKGYLFWEHDDPCRQFLENYWIRKTQRMGEVCGRGLAGRLPQLCIIPALSTNNGWGEHKPFYRNCRNSWCEPCRYIHTAMGKPDSMTAYRARSEE